MILNRRKLTKKVYQICLSVLLIIAITMGGVLIYQAMETNESYADSSAENSGLERISLTECMLDSGDVHLACTDLGDNAIYEFAWRSVDPGSEWETYRSEKPSYDFEVPKYHYEFKVRAIINGNIGEWSEIEEENEGGGLYDPSIPAPEITGYSVDDEGQVTLHCTDLGEGLKYEFYEYDDGWTTVGTLKYGETKRFKARVCTADWEKFGPWSQTVTITREAPEFVLSKKTITFDLTGDDFWRGIMIVSGAGIEDGGYTIQSSDPSIATGEIVGDADGDFYIRAKKKAGTCVITIADKFGHEKQVKVTVKGAYNNWSIPKRLTLYVLNPSEPIWLSINGQYNDQLTFKATSSNTKILRCYREDDHTFFLHIKKTGKATVTVRDSLGRERTCKITIIKVPISAIYQIVFGELGKSKTYNGKKLKPVKMLSYSEYNLKKGKDYTVKYKNNKNVGRGTIIIKLKGNFTGTKKISFSIIPKGTRLVEVAKSRKACIVKWKKQAEKMSKSRITGYQIMLATNSKFTKGKKQVIAKGYKTTKKKIKNLTANKKYFVKIRTYKKIGSKIYYSKWSKAKSFVL